MFYAELLQVIRDERIHEVASELVAKLRHTPGWRWLRWRRLTRDLRLLQLLALAFNTGARWAARTGYPGAPHASRPESEKHRAPRVGGE